MHLNIKSISLVESLTLAVILQGEKSPLATEQRGQGIKLIFNLQQRLPLTELRTS